MATERERKVQEKIMRIIRHYRGYVYKNAQNEYTEKGRPDLSSCIPVKVSTLVDLFGKDATVGLFLGIEVKRQGFYDNASEAQKIVGNKIRNAGGMWFIIDDPDIIEGLMIKLVGDEEDGIQ